MKRSSRTIVLAPPVARDVFNRSLCSTFLSAFPFPSRPRVILISLRASLRVRARRVTAPMNVYPKKKWEPELRAACARVSRTGDFTNDAGLKLRWYSWEVPRPKCIVVFAHGLGVHGSFEMLASVPPGTPRRHYETSWPERMNKSDVSLFCLDHQGHGRSESAVAGERCYFHRLDHLVDDFATFCGHVREERPDVPVFIVGTSLGGYVATKTAMEYPTSANGLVTLAPMLSLDRLSKRPLNRVLLPFTTLLSMFIPRVPLAKTMKNTKFPMTQKEVEEDPYTWASGVRYTRVRVAAEAYLSTLRLKKPGELEKITMPVISFHGREDEMTDPKSSEMLVERANTSDKRLEWVDDVFHDLCHERPTSDHICDEVIAWCLERVGGPKSARSGAKRARDSAAPAKPAKKPAAKAKKPASKAKSTAKTTAKGKSTKTTTKTTAKKTTRSKSRR